MAREKIAWVGMSDWRCRRFWCLGEPAATTQLFEIDRSWYRSFHELVNSQNGWFIVYRFISWQIQSINLSKLQRRHTTSLEIWPRYRIKLVMCKWTMRVLICADSMFFHCQCSSPLPASFFLPLRCKDPQCRRLPFLLALPYPIWRRKSGAARLLGARPHIFVKSPRPCLIPYLEIWISTHDPWNIVIWPDTWIQVSSEDLCFLRFKGSSTWRK